MPRLKLRIKVTARSKVKQVHFRIRIAIRVFYISIHAFKVVRDPCQKITLLLLKSKSVRVIVTESCF